MICTAPAVACCARPRNPYKLSENMQMLEFKPYKPSEIMLMLEFKCSSNICTIPRRAQGFRHRFPPDSWPNVAPTFARSNLARPRNPYKPSENMQMLEFKPYEPSEIMLMLDSIAIRNQSPPRPPPSEMGPCLRALLYFKMSENCEARISIFDARGRAARTRRSRSDSPRAGSRGRRGSRGAGWPKVGISELF